MGATGVMLLTGASTVSQFAAQRQQAGAVLAQGGYHQRLAEWNARIAEQQAQDVIERGRRGEMRLRTNTKQLIGAQRTAMAAQGIEIDSGSALDVQADTAALGELDALTLRNNAARESFGYEVQAADYRQQGEMARLAARNEAANLNNASWGTLLTGAAQLGSQYYNARSGTSSLRGVRGKAPKGVRDLGGITDYSGRA